MIKFGFFSRNANKGLLKSSVGKHVAAMNLIKCSLHKIPKDDYPMVHHNLEKAFEYLDPICEMIMDKRVAVFSCPHCELANKNKWFTCSAHG